MSTANINFPTRPLGTEHPEATAARHAKTLDEIRGIQQQNMLLADQVTTLEREKQGLLDRVDLLVDDNRRHKREARIFMEKMMELATSSANIGLLARKAEEIVLSAKELLNNETDEQAEAERASAEAAVKALPESQVKPGLSVIDQVGRDLLGV